MAVPAPHTSLTRGNRDRLNRNTFRCTAYGHTADAEVNGAENIRRKGLADPPGRAAGGLQVSQQAKPSPAPGLVAGTAMNTGTQVQSLA